MNITNIKNILYFKRSKGYNCTYLLMLLQDDEDACNNTKCADCYLDMEFSRALFMRRAV